MASTLTAWETSGWWVSAARNHSSKVIVAVRKCSGKLMCAFNCTVWPCIAGCWVGAQGGRDLLSGAAWVALLAGVLMQPQKAAVRVKENFLEQLAMPEGPLAGSRSPGVQHRVGLQMGRLQIARTDFSSSDGKVLWLAAQPLQAVSAFRKAWQQLQAGAVRSCGLASIAASEELWEQHQWHVLQKASSRRPGVHLSCNSR